MIPAQFAQEWSRGGGKRIRKKNKGGKTEKSRREQHNWSVCAQAESQINRPAKSRANTRVLLCVTSEICYKCNWCFDFMFYSVASCKVAVLPSNCKVLLPQISYQGLHKINMIKKTKTKLARWLCSLFSLLPCLEICVISYAGSVHRCKGSSSYKAEENHVVLPTVTRTRLLSCTDNLMIKNLYFPWI